MERTPVLIAGGGPVGLMLALELDYHGIDAILVERNPTTTRHPKMDITNGRSMELFRRLGVIDALRAEAVPEDHPVSVIWVDTLLGRELARFDYPSVGEMRRILREKNDGTMAAEPSMRISQVQLEPVLKGVLENGSGHVDVRFGWGLETFTQDDHGRDRDRPQHRERRDRTDPRAVPGGLRRRRQRDAQDARHSRQHHHPRRLPGRRRRPPQLPGHGPGRAAGGYRAGAQHVHDPLDLAGAGPVRAVRHGVAHPVGDGLDDHLAERPGHLDGAHPAPRDTGPREPGPEGDPVRVPRLRVRVQDPGRQRLGTAPRPRRPLRRRPRVVGGRLRRTRSSPPAATA